MSYVEFHKKAVFNGAIVSRNNRGVREFFNAEGEIIAEWFYMSATGIFY